MDGPGGAHRALIPPSLGSAQSALVPWFTLLSLKVDLDPGGYLEDLGVFLEVLGVLVISI